MIAVASMNRLQWLNESDGSFGVYMSCTILYINAEVTHTFCRKPIRLI